VQVTVTIRGGMMDDDRVTAISGDQLVVTDHGKIRAERRLTRDAVHQVERLATDVLGVRMPKRTYPEAVDGGTTTIEIVAAKTRRIELWAGEDAPDPVWALLYAVEGLAQGAA
jgi:hypothetical protein